MINFVISFFDYIFINFVVIVERVMWKLSSFLIRDNDFYKKSNITLHKQNDLLRQRNQLLDAEICNLQKMAYFLEIKAEGQECRLKMKIQKLKSEKLRNTASKVISLSINAMKFQTKIQDKSIALANFQEEVS